MPESVQKLIENQELNPNELKLLIIEWLDAQSIDDWTNIYEVQLEKAPKILTCGWMVSQTEESIIVAANLDLQNLKLCGAMLIPKKMIQSITNVTPQPATPCRITKKRK